MGTHSANSRARVHAWDNCNVAHTRRTQDISAVKHDATQQQLLKSLSEEDRSEACDNHAPTTRHAQQNT